VGKDIERREFFKDVAKYGGIGLAAMGLLHLHKAKEAGAVADLDDMSSSESWRVRDTYTDQADEFVSNAPNPPGHFTKEPEEFVNDMKPVNWSHLHPNWYAGKGNKALVSITQTTPLNKDIKGDIKRALDKLGGLEKSLKKTDRILIKPNTNSGDRWPRGGTDYRFLDALIQILHDEGYGNLAVGRMGSSSSISTRPSGCMSPMRARNILERLEGATGPLDTPSRFANLTRLSTSRS
jgi:hypothetical protein